MSSTETDPTKTADPPENQTGSGGTTSAVDVDSTTTDAAPADPPDNQEGGTQ